MNFGLCEIDVFVNYYCIYYEEKEHEEESSRERTVETYSCHRYVRMRFSLYVCGCFEITR